MGKDFPINIFFYAPEGSFGNLIFGKKNLQAVHIAADPGSMFGNPWVLEQTFQRGAERVVLLRGETGKLPVFPFWVRRRLFLNPGTEVQKGILILAELFFATAFF